MNLERYKYYSYTDEYIGILFDDNSEDLYDFVLKSSICDFGNNKECIFTQNFGKISFNSFISKSFCKVLLPINKTTLDFVDLIEKNKNNKINKKGIDEFIFNKIKYYFNSFDNKQYCLSSLNFYNKYKNESVKISTIDKNFIYKDSNILEKELITFINDFKIKFEHKGIYTWNNSFGSIISGNQESFLAKDGEIDICGFYKSIEENTKYQKKELKDIFKGLLLNSSYNVDTLHYEGLLEYSTHNPKMFELLKELTYTPQLSKDFYEKLEKNINSNILKNGLNKYVDLIKINESNYKLCIKDELIKDKNNLKNQDKIEVLNFKVFESNLEEYKINYGYNTFHGKLNKFLNSISYNDMILPELLNSMKPFENYNEIASLIQENIDNITKSTISYHKPNTQKDYIFEDLSQKRTLSEFNKLVKNSNLNKLNYIKLELNNNQSLTIIQNNDLSYTILNNNEVSYKDIPKLRRNEFIKSIQDSLKLKEVEIFIER